jgi:PAS domain S-box-containing protein
MITQTQTDASGEPALDGPGAELPLDGHLIRIIAGGTDGPARASNPSLTRTARVRARRYRRFLDALGVALYTTDQAGRITFYNVAAASFWGREPEIGEEWCGSLRLYWPDGTPMPHGDCPMARALKEERPMHGHEAVAERPDGSRVSFVAYPTPLHDDAGSLIGAVNILVDVTERRRAEDALRAAAAALEVSNTVKDEFLGLVSHELRTPVTTILGNARLLHDRAGTLGEAQRTSMVADIAADAERLHEIIENLLYMTRLGAGSRPELEPTALDRVVQRSTTVLRRRHPDREIEVHCQHGLVVDAERTYLELLVENLVGNAAKYSEPGTPIEVSVHPQGAEAIVRVLDRGIGFDGVDPALLFEPFYRAAAARSTANGIGIGLAVCRRIVDLLGGRIWARQRHAGGAEFGFALPLLTDSQDPAPG